MAVRMGGAAGVVLRIQEAQELLLHLLTGESWVSSRLVWASPRLHLGQKGYNLNERAKLALIEALQTLLVEAQGLGSIAPVAVPAETWQKTILELAQTQLSSPEDAVHRIGKVALDLGLKGASLWLREQGERTLQLVARYPEASAPVVVSQTEHPVYFSILERNLIVPIDDVRQDARVTELREMLAGRGIGSILHTVVHNENGVRGMLWLENAHPRKWSSQDEMLATSLGQILERAVKSTRLEVKVGQERKTLALKRADLELNLSQALSLAQRHGRSLALIRLKAEKVSKHQHELIARELNASLRQSDALAYMGDEGFALLLSEVRFASGASRVAHRVLGRLRGALGGAKVGIGISLFPQDAAQAEGLWQQAEKACMQALDQGGGIRLLTPGVSELQEAISRDTLTLHFQPILRLSDLELVSVEALARWPKARGMHQAGEFLPLAEQVGLLGAQDRWTLDKVLEQAALWRPSGVKSRFSLNISGETLTDPYFPNQLQEMLAGRRLTADLLMLEVQEQDLLEDLEAATRALEILKKLGVLVALDNFGHQPLPLTQLRKLAFDWVKLHPNLLATENAPLTKATLELVRAVGAKAVAKGLEEQAQLTRMKELGCDFGQGHVLGWPVPAEDLGALLVWGIGS
jgi:EAL domain-containing protein (putative c-di-GMP-specific phosphodiesterase class I)/GAF domain-containing protein